MTETKHNKYFVWKKEGKYLVLSFWGFKRNFMFYAIWDKVLWVELRVSENILKADAINWWELDYKTLIDFDSRQFIQLNDNLDKRGTENDYK